MADGQLPALPGWDVEVDGGRWRARRKGGLSALQVEYGCKLVVEADSFGELELKVTAQNILATMIQAAERLYERLAEADAVRRAISGDEHQAADDER